jgi:hypothetical protein
MLNFSILNHFSLDWRSSQQRPIITHFISCGLNALARADRSVGVGVKMNENKYFYKSNVKSDRSAHKCLFTYCPQVIFFIKKLGKTKKGLREKTQAKRSSAINEGE